MAGVLISAGADSHAAVTFRCPRCGSVYPVVTLLRNWREWGVICLCAEAGALNPECPAIDAADGPPAHTRRDDELDEWLAGSFPASDPLPGPSTI